jgi:hypothetical protein
MKRIPKLDTVIRSVIIKKIWTALNFKYSTHFYNWHEFPNAVKINCA